jgi:hypothetical protein
MAEVLSCALRDHGMSKVVQDPPMSTTFLRLSRFDALPVGRPCPVTVPHTAAESLYPFAAQWLLHLPPDLTYKTSALVWSGNSLLAFASRVILNFRHHRTHDHIFLFHNSILRILPTQCICVFRMALTVNRDCFPKQH